MLYKPGHFQHIEVAGIDNESFQAQTIRRKESPETFLLSTLMISVLTIAGYGPEAEAGMDKALRETFNYEGSGIDPVANFKSQKMGQMFRTLDMAIEQGVISPQEVIKGTDELLDVNPGGFRERSGIRLNDFQTEGMTKLRDYMSAKI